MKATKKAPYGIYMEWLGHRQHSSCFLGCMYMNVEITGQLQVIIPHLSPYFWGKVSCFATECARQLAYSFQGILWSLPGILPYRDYRWFLLSVALHGDPNSGPQACVASVLTRAILPTCNVHFNLTGSCLTIFKTSSTDLQSSQHFKWTFPLLHPHQPLILPASLILTILLSI